MKAGPQPQEEARPVWTRWEGALDKYLAEAEPWSLYLTQKPYRNPQAYIWDPQGSAQEGPPPQWPRTWVLARRYPGMIVPFLPGLEDSNLPLCLGNNQEPELREFPKLSKEQKAWNRSAVVMGPQNWVQAYLEQSLGKRKISTRHYQYLVLPENQPLDLPQFPPDMEFRPLDSHNWRETYPLQKAYELEEVLLSVRDFREGPSRIRFQSQILQQWGLVLYHQGQALAKIQTNCLGQSWVQIGGLYCKPEYRHRGLSRNLMLAFLHQIQSRNYRVGLYVKNDNLPALGLYRSLGFQPLGPYQISYL